MLSHLCAWLALRLRPDRGATAAEYGLVVALLVIVAIGAGTLIGDDLGEGFGGASGKVTLPGT
jgi:pilus assembly protein Flp/PilA